jgi:hypothetical protein
VALALGEAIELQDDDGLVRRALSRYHGMQPDGVGCCPDNCFVILRVTPQKYTQLDAI